MWCDNRTVVQARIDDTAAAGRSNSGRLDGIGIHYGGIASEVPGAGGGSLGSGGEAYAHSKGSIPCVSWFPGRVLSTDITQNSMISVLNGDFDSEFTSALTYWKNLGYRIMWRLCWEFDGNWFPWSPTANASANDNQPNPGCTSAQWIAAWQYIVALRNSIGASNVGFWWCPTDGYNRSLATACYPGNSYVDWVGSDIYNQADDTTGGNHPIQTSPLHAGWAEFWECFNYTGHGTAAASKHDEFGPLKPFVAGETGTLYLGTDANSKANWYRNIVDHAYALPTMPYLCGIQFFDADLHTSEGFNWRVDYAQTYTQKAANQQGTLDATTYTGFKDFASRAALNVGPSGGST